MAIENLEARIGNFNRGKDTGRTMPRFDVNGHVYSYPGTWLHLDKERFVVVPPNFHNEALIEGIKKQLGIGAKSSSKAKGDDGE